MVTFKERLQALREKLRSKRSTSTSSTPLKKKTSKFTRAVAVTGAALGGAVMVVPAAAVVTAAGVVGTVAVGGLLAYQAAKRTRDVIAGDYPKNLRRQGQRLTKAERKELKAQGSTTRRGSMEPSRIVRARKTRRIRQAVQNVQTGAMSYQNVRENTPIQQQGITQAISTSESRELSTSHGEFGGLTTEEWLNRGRGSVTSIMLGDVMPLENVRAKDARTAYLAQPERAKTHRTYNNFDFFGTKSKKGATDWRYDYEEMFRNV